MKIKNLYNQLKTNKGFTVDTNLEDYQGKGYAVAVPNNETIIIEDQLTFELFQKLIADYQSKAKSAHIGAWVDSDKIYFDVSQIFDNKLEAIDKGKEFNQLAIFDFNNFTSIPLK